MFSRLFHRLRRPPPQLSKGSFYFFSSVSAAAVPSYLLLNSESLPSPQTPHEQPLKAIIRAYLVYSACSIPALVDYSPKILDTLSRVPGLKQLTYGIVRVTFFEQFVGGETASAALPLLRSLRAANKGALFAYSVEVDEHEALGSSNVAKGASKPADPPHKRIVQEILNCIDVAADFEDSLRGASKSLFPYHSIVGAGGIDGLSQEPDSSLSGLSPIGRRTWVAVKLTAMLPNANALINFSKCITMTRERMQGARSASFEPSSDHQAYERLHAISHGRDSVPVELIPFPGSPFPSDMNFILSSTESRDGSGLTPEDIHDLRELYNDLLSICKRAQERGVKLILDAEYSWYQPAMDALALALMRQFNALPSGSSKSTNEQHHPYVQPLVYTTYQAYLRRTPLHLASTVEDARRNNYALGVKLVRGAYHHQEVSAHHSPDSPSLSHETEPPVWTTKADTDKAYNECVQLAISTVKGDIEREMSLGQGTIGIGVLFGTHNWDSCNLVLDQLIKIGQGKVVTASDGVEKVKLSDAVVERVAIGQLYGMCDDLTDSIVARTISSAPLAINRRAVENKSVLGGGAAAKERSRAVNEIWKRVKRSFGAVDAGP
ncbi:hypothetical protein EST38_g6864 [Candolleomyces aberdarensis]|uniref:Proline dehydrogenase n=1 Tax=Candolleomyces aberdarensis TaxID=2316362 RepID=A0A4Q2DGL5_9AGAR|nr:hypothetical protein EST38_g6864 [Candolleomyces aberdarensis]